MLTNSMIGGKHRNGSRQSQKVNTPGQFHDGISCQAKYWGGGSVHCASSTSRYRSAILDNMNSQN